MSNNTLNYGEQGGARSVIGGALDVVSGGEIDIESGANFKLGGTALTASAAELNITHNMPASITFAAAPGAANVSELTITVKDGAGATIAEVFNLDVWLSDAATGAGLTSTTASGTVQAKSANGADLGVLTAKKALRVQTLDTGVYILEITDTAKTTFYVCATLPSTGATVVSDQLETADYGS